MFSWIKSLFGFGKVEVEQPHEAPFLDLTRESPPAPVETPVETPVKKAATSPKPKKEKLPKFDEMTKAMIDAWAKEHGVELDSKKTKKVMIETLKQKLKEK